MEGAAFILIGAALFSHSWYLMGVYPEGRTMGMYVGGFGLAVLIALVFAPMLLTGMDDAGKEITSRSGRVLADPVTEVMILKTLIVLWSAYAIGVAANGLWEFDDRAIGFYGGFLSVATLVGFIYYVSQLQSPYGEAIWLGMAGATLILSVLAGLVFFYLAIPFNALRLVTAWVMVIGSIAVAAIGLAMLTTAIEFVS